jgi:hypothetical protein
MHSGFTRRRTDAGCPQKVRHPDRKRASGRGLAAGLLALLLGAGAAGPVFAQQLPRAGTGVGIFAGLYAADGIATNFYYGARYDYGFQGGKFFVEAALGVGSLESKVLDAVTSASLFESSRLLTYEFGVAYDHTPTGPVPFVLLGVTGIDQGGQTKFAGVVGFGKRFLISGIFDDRVIARLDVRDHMFSQEFNNKGSFVAHNLGLTVGLTLAL